LICGNRHRRRLGLAAYWTPNVTITGTGGNPERVLAATCSSSIFDVIGVSPIAARAFIADDDVSGARRVAVIGHGLWQRRFGADPAAIGRELTLDGSADPDCRCDAAGLRVSGRGHRAVDPAQAVAHATAEPRYYTRRLSRLQHF
jgi:hypothetical protein